MNFKRIISVFLALIMITATLASLTVSAGAASSDNRKVSAARIWNGKADKSWFTGKKKSYSISTAEQLAGLSELVRDAADDDRFRGITINLTNDIVLNDTSNYKNWPKKAPKNNWDPIGKVGGPIKGYCPFAGVFNGNGHTISGMYVECDEPAGLFCYTSGAVVRDLRIEKSCILSKSDSAGTFAGTAENSYFENVEADSVTVIARGGRWAGAGGIIGNAAQTNNIATVSYAFLLGLGIVVNPLIWFDKDVDKKPDMYGTYVVNAKVSGSEIRAESGIYTYAAGGIVGGAAQPTAYYRCLVADCSFASYTDFGLGGEGVYGGLVGTFEHSAVYEEKIIKDCWISGCKRTDRYKGERTDKKLVPEIKKSKLTSSDFAKKLGSDFKYSKNNPPLIKSINRPSVQIILNGTKASFKWDSVSGAKAYKIYKKNSNGKYEAIATVKSNETTLKNIKKGKSYNFIIKADIGNGNYKEIGGAFKLKA